MKEAASIQYSNLSAENKNEIQRNLKKHKDLKVGFYSPVYNINVNGENHSYRFHSTLRSEKKKITIVFNKNEKINIPYRKGNIIHFYDKELKRTLKLDKSLLEEELEKIVNYNLSSEQKELLAEGQDITLEVTSSKKSIKDNKQVFVPKKELKSFVADYSFFLGKTSLLTPKEPKTKSMYNLNLTK